MNRPAVQDAPPSKKVLRFVNPVLRALLRSPLHRILDRKPIAITVTGRKTGRTYTLPVGRHESPDGTFVLSAGGNWRHNLPGGADIRATLEGRGGSGTPVLEEDLDRPAETFKTMLDRSGPRALAVKVNVDRAPTVAEIRPVLADRGVAYLTLAD